MSKLFVQSKIWPLRQQLQELDLQIHSSVAWQNFSMTILLLCVHLTKVFQQNHVSLFSHLENMNWIINLLKVFCQTFVRILHWHNDCNIMRKHEKIEISQQRSYRSLTEVWQKSDRSLTNVGLLSDFCQTCVRHLSDICQKPSVRPLHSDWNPHPKISILPIKLSSPEIVNFWARELIFCVQCYFIDSWKYNNNLNFPHS